MTKIFVNTDYARARIDELRKRFPSAQFSETEAFDEEVIFGNYPVNQLHRFTHLKWIQLSSAGLNQYAYNDKVKNILVTNASTAYDLAISEYILGVHLALYKNLHRYRDLQKQHLWQGINHSKMINGSTVMVFGLGNIGKTYAKMIHTMGAKVIGVKRNIDLSFPYIEKLYNQDTFQEAIDDVDAIIICAPGTKETYQLFDISLFKRMKKDAILINIGRGSIIKTDDLVEALDKKMLVGCALDVFDPEPLPENHPLWDFENVIMTPHKSWGPGNNHTHDRVFEIFCTNLNQYLNHEPLNNVVDIEEGY